MVQVVRRCRVAALALCAVAIVCGCGTATVTASPTNTSAVSAAPSPSPSASASAIATASPTPSATAPSWSTLTVSKPIKVVAPCDFCLIVAWHDEYVAAGSMGDGDGVATSSDLIHWKIVASGNKVPVAARLLVGPTGLLVAYNAQGLWTSVDAITWTPVSNLPFQPSIIKISAGRRGLVAATVDSDADDVWFSADGTSWTPAPSADALLQGNTMFDLFAGPTGFFITGEIGRASWFENRAGNWAGWWSSDGLTWQRAIIDDATGFGANEEVHFAANGMFIEEGYFGQWHSIDGLSWVKTTKSDTPKAEFGGDSNLTYIDGGDRRIAVDCSVTCNRAWETLDGSTWKPIKITIPKSARSDVDEMLPNNEFVAFTKDGMTLYCSIGGAMGTPVTTEVIRIAAAP